MKRVGEFIKNGHEKVSPTSIGSGSGMTLSLCHSVTVRNKRSNISAAFHLFGLNFFCVHLGKKVCLKFYFFRPRAGWATAGGQKTVIFQAISAISQDIGPKIET